MPMAPIVSAESDDLDVDKGSFPFWLAGRPDNRLKSASGIRKLAGMVNFGSAILHFTGLRKRSIQGPVMR